MTHSLPAQIQNIFDPKWYLAKYQDVAHAGTDPFEHFVNFGWMEGRWPCAIKAVQLDDAMWANQSPHDAECRLKDIIEHDVTYEKALASWFICRWLGSWGKWEEAKKYVTGLFENSDLWIYVKHEGPFLLAFTILLKCGEESEAKNLLTHPHWQDSNNKILAAAMLQTGKSRLRIINTIFSNRGFMPIEEISNVTLDNISSNTSGHILTLSKFSPLVSIIIPCFNAEKTISTALNSLTRQTYSKLEIIVIDDCSTDNSASIIKELASQDKRIRYVRLEQNSGAYAARNRGLDVSKGKFITTHDADDWSHPQKIELQVSEVRKSRKVKAVVSHWVRTSPELEFERWRMEEGWIYRNVSSLMFRRSVFRKLGYWDTVSVNADTEYYLRILKKYGNSALTEVLPGLPLSFGRVDNGSLTQVSTTHLRTQFSGIRKDYIDAAVAWHNNTRSLYMPKKGLRKFVAPPYICRGAYETRAENLKRVLESKGLFDKEWYLTAYPDIADAGVDPLKHFIHHGVNEGRDPNPLFSLSGYAYIERTDRFTALSKWTRGDKCFNDVIHTNIKKNNHRANSVLMIAHQSESELFGAELSFLDSVKMARDNGIEIHVILPSAKNPDYINELKKHATNIYCIPLAWWNGERNVILETVTKIESVIDEVKPLSIYVNTLVLWEPLIAAKNKGIKSTIHVRELPEHDASLCEILKSTPEQIRNHTISICDNLIANSYTTAGYLNAPEKTTVLYNVNSLNFKEKKFDFSSKNQPLKVVMLSSNLPKKGISDFFNIAKICNDKLLPLVFDIYGKHTPELEYLLNNSSIKNLRYNGYCDAKDVYERSHIVLNLSHFQESFGRTIVEGMASGCLVISYNWGAPSELIKPGTGILIEKMQWKDIVMTLEQIVNGEINAFAITKKAIIYANDTFSERRISSKLATLLI